MASVGCSNGPKAPAQAPIQFVQPSSSPHIDPAQTIALSVAVADGSPVTWTLESAFGKPVGTLASDSGNTNTYIAPDSVTKETQVSIVATAGVNSATLGLFIEPAPQITGTSSTTAASCPPFGSVVLPSAAGAKIVGQALQPGDLKVIESGGVAPYTWSVSTGSLPEGLTLQLASDTSTPSIVGTPITTGCSTFSLQVTDSAGVSATSSPLSLVMIPPALKVNTPLLHNALIDAANNGVPYTPATMVATGGTVPYTWSLVGVGGQTAFPTGMSMNSAGLITGVPSSVDLTQNGGFGVFSPNMLVSDNQFPYPATATSAPHIQVLSLDDSCISERVGNLKPQGSYAFQLRGFDANGPVTISGNFTVDGDGAITGGKEDVNRTSGAQTNLSVLPASTYTLDNGGRGCVTLVNSAGASTFFRIAMGGCSTGRDSSGTDCQAASNGDSFYFTSGHMIEFDDTTGSGTRASGNVRLQDSSTFQDSGISGMYAFGLSGWDASNARFAMAGSATASSGSWSSVAADANDAGTLGSSLTGGSGSFTVGSDGRGTGSLSVGNLVLSVVLYPVSNHEVMVATVGPPSANNPQLSGEAISTTGPFSFQSLQNSHIFHIAGMSPSGPDPSVGTLSFDGSGGLTGMEYENQAGTLSSLALSGAYSMDSTSGRFSFFAPLNTQNIGLHPLVGYVIPVGADLNSTACITQAACVTGFLLSTDSTAQAGVLEFQTPTIAPPPPFLVTALAGDYVFGTDEPLDGVSVNISGRASLSPSGPTVNATQDTSYGATNYCLESNCLLLIPSDQSSSAYAINSDGSGKFGGQTASVTNGSVTFYIDESPLDFHPAVLVVRQ